MNFSVQEEGQMWQSSTKLNLLHLLSYMFVGFWINLFHIAWIIIDGSKSLVKEIFHNLVKTIDLEQAQRMSNISENTSTAILL